ncbi:MAG TPA: hypothetical protein VN695_17580 [Streptosporangiaceae bacterium]|nr:hypothetical protein [Streptosporangiaceae bacterium]
MDTMYQAVSYLGMRARKLGRAIFHNDAGALTLEWIVIAAALVVAVGVAAALFKNAIKAEAKKLP